MTRLTGIDKTEGCFLYVFTKENSFIGSFGELLFELGFEEWDLPSMLGWEGAFDFKEVVDKHISITFEGENAPRSVVVVFGKERIFVIASGKDLENFNMLVGERFSF